MSFNKLNAEKLVNTELQNWNQIEYEKIKSMVPFEKTNEVIIEGTTYLIHIEIDYVHEDTDEIALEVMASDKLGRKWFPKHISKEIYYTKRA